MLTAAGVKILDFGLAKPVEEPAAADSTDDPGAVMNPGIASENSKSV